MDLNQSIDIYCEREGPGFWAEPVNALSNIAFIIAALLAWKLYVSHSKSNTKKDVPIYILITLGFAIGIGSFLFHTFATLWAQVLDVTPIMIFAVYYFFIALKKFIGCNNQQRVIGLMVFAGLYLLNGLIFPRGSLNGTSEYLPFLYILFLFSVILQYQKNSANKSFWIITGIFSMALLFRTIDLIACPYTHVGTHFFWHIFNGIVVYLLLRILILTKIEEL